MAVDLYFIYRFIKKLTTPFKDWDAFKTGVIDENGDVLVKFADRTTEQKASLAVFDRLALRLKKIIAKIPGVNTRLASYAAALYLIKESKQFSEGMINESLDFESNDFAGLNEAEIIKFIEEQIVIVHEEMVTTASIAPLIDGKSVSKKAQKKHVEQNATDADDTDDKSRRRVVGAIK